MITITEVQRYVLPNGQEFTTEAKAIAHLENEMREAFDRMVLLAATLHPKERILLSDAFIAHRDELAELCWVLCVQGGE